MNTLKVISYNVKGLHNPIKKKKILHQLRQVNCQIAFLQETRLSDAEHEKLKSWADKVYYSSHRSILIHRQINFTKTLIHKDTEGRYILVNGLVDGVEVSLINVCAPNEDEPGFIKTLFSVVLKYSTGLLLMEEDFNCVISQQMDRQPPSKAPLPRMSKMLRYQTTEASMVDIWRSKFPRDRDFTFYLLDLRCYAPVVVILYQSSVVSFNTSFSVTFPSSSRRGHQIVGFALLRSLVYV